MLPFGLASACYAFTKLTRPLVKKWREQGIRCTMFLDDGIQAAETYERAYLQGNRQKQDMKKAGLTINFEKSNFTPVQQGSWLGFDIDTAALKLYVPKAKIEHLINLLNSLSSSLVTSAREVSKIAGRIISMQLAIGPLARLFTRHMHYFIENRSFWDSRHIINIELRKEIGFWRRNLKNSKRFPN